MRNGIGAACDFSHSLQQLQLPESNDYSNNLSPEESVDSTVQNRYFCNIKENAKDTAYHVPGT